MDVLHNYTFHLGREEGKTIKWESYFWKWNWCTTRRLSGKVRRHSYNSCPVLYYMRTNTDTDTHTPTCLFFSGDPSSAVGMCVRGLRGDIARCGCKWTAVTLYSCLFCCCDTLAVALVTRTMCNIRFTFGKSCPVEFEFTSCILMSDHVPQGVSLIGECWNFLCRSCFVCVCGSV